MDTVVDKDKSLKSNSSSKETRPKKSKFENKQRSTINISLQKRNIGLLNSILNGWVEEGYNISNEICNAIIFKNKSDINPHIKTILSTLSLIESSLKSQKSLESMSDEEIDLKVLEIFNEVITINIDGTKLTNLLKSTSSPVGNSLTNENDISSFNQNESIEATQKLRCNNDYEVQVDKETSADFKDVKESSSDSSSFENVNPNLNPNLNIKKNETLDWSNSFPKEKVGDKKTENKTINSPNSNLIKGFVTQAGFR